MRITRITQLIAAVLLAAGLVAAFSTPSNAASGFQYVSGFQGGVQVVNAWNGGPWVKVYNMTGSTNNDFTAEQNPNTGAADPVIMFTGNGAWSGRCVGDANNDSGDARASLDACATNGNTGGWGTNWTFGSSGCNSGQEWFHNNHWNGYLAGSGPNGTSFYLNVQTKVCFSVLGAA